MRILSYISFFLIIIILLSCSTTKSLETSSLTTYDISELDSLVEQADRPIVIFIHAEWCTYCRNMEHTTFRNEDIKKLLMSKYHFVSFDGEDKRSLKFDGNMFTYKPHGNTSGTNELTQLLAEVDGELSYPTLVIMTPSRKIVERYNTFLSSEHLLEIL